MKDWQIIIVAMILIAALCAFAIARELDGTIYYLGITLIAGLGGLEASYINKRTSKG